MLTKEERRILLLSHVGLQKITTLVLPTMLVLYYGSSDVLVTLEIFLICINVSNVFQDRISQGILYSKNFYVGAKTYFLLFTIPPTLVALLAPVSLAWRYSLLIIAVYTVGAFNGAYGAIHKPTQRSKINFSWVIYFSTLFPLAVSLDLHHNIQLSFLSSMLVLDLVWFVLESFIYWRKGRWKNFFVKYPDEVSKFYYALAKVGFDVLNTTVDVLLILYLMSIVPKDFALFTYVLLGKCTTGDLIREYLGQIRRVVIEGASVRTYLTNVAAFLFLSYQGLQLGLYCFYSDKPFEPWVFLFMVSVNMVYRWVQLHSGVYQIQMEYLHEIKGLTVTKTLNTVLVVLLRTVFPSIFVVNFDRALTQIINIPVYKKYLKEGR